jgi:hypothetical protein
VRIVLIASLLSSGIASADDPRADVFGMKPKAKEPEESCEDGRTFGCSTATDRFDPVSPALLRTWLSSEYLLALPVADARQFDVAHFATGASRDEAGPYFAGATGLENTWTIEGAPVENLRTGNLETRVPLTFMTGMLVSAGGFAARDRVGLGGSIDVELVRGGDKHEVEAYAWAGLSEDARERPIARGSYQLRRVGVDAGPETALSVVAHGPLGELRGGRAWYAAGVAANIGASEIRWQASRLVDANGDSIPDGLPGFVETVPFSNTSETMVDFLIPVMARAGWTRGHHDVTLTLMGNAVRDGVFLANATQQAAGVERRAYIVDGIAAWKGTWKHTRARAMLAWHRSMRSESAWDDAAENRRQLLTAYVPDELAEDPQLATECRDGVDGDPVPTLPNCPIPFGFFASGGAGELVDSTGDRPTVTADIAHHWGRHVLRAGGTFEDSRLVDKSRFTGGVLERSLFDGHFDRQRFFVGFCGEEPDTGCRYVDQFEIAYRTRYTAAFVEDTFELTEHLRVDTGLRWELMWVGPRLHYSDQFAPRLGIAWDVLGNGQSRWWATMGRQHALLPAGLGPTIIQREARVRDVELAGIPADRILDVGNVFRIEADIRPATQDEVATGFEIGYLKTARVGAWIQRRSLRSGLETVMQSPITFEAFFANPGTTGPFDTLASREATVFAVDLHIAPSPALGVRATYMFGRTVGTWTGPFDPRQGATLYAGTDWDLDATNLYGHLPTDPGHRIAIEADRRSKAFGIDYLLAARLVANSGKPRSVLSDGDLGVVQLLPRGSDGRLPMLSQANVRVGAVIRGVDVMLDVFNAFDRREAVTIGEVYTGGGVRPIVGGTRQDLVFAKDEACNDDGMCSARPAQRRSTFGLPTSFQSPRAFVLGVRHSW